MGPTAFRILLIEDNDLDALIVQEGLARHGGFTVEVTTTLQTGIARAKLQDYDAVLLDLTLPDSSGIETLREYCAHVRTPVVVLTGIDDERIALDALRQGAQDYLVKGRDDSVPRALKYAVERGRARDILANATRSNADLLSFAQVTSHDLQAPLRQIVSLVDLLQTDHAGGLDQEGRERLARMKNTVTRMQELIRGILEYSRIEATALARTEVDTGALVESLRDLLQSQLTAVRAILCVDPLPNVYGDARQLQEVFQNLLTNAIKYRTTREPVIRVSSRRGTGEWVFLVEDNGRGFDPSQAKRMFQRFTRLAGSESATGSGIGLALCERIIEKHGGRIWAEGRPGLGSTFFFTIPDAPRADPSHTGRTEH